MRAIDLFCGAGGSSWGAQKAGVEIVAAFDSWELAGKNHHVNFPDALFYPTRLEDVNISEVKKDLGHMDLILASPECTNHSPAKGNKIRCEESKNTAFQVTRFARELKPRWIVIENVVSMRRWSRYQEFKKELEADYHVREEVLDSSDFGVPQSRRRLFLLCDRQRMPDPTPTIGGRKKTIQSIINLNGAYRWSPLQTERRAKATLERAERGINEVGADSPFLLVYYGSDQAGGWQELSRPLRTITTLDRFAIVKPSSKGHLMRMLQVPELQLAMGMGGMQFEHGTRREQIKMIGNAVCPPVMQAVIQQLTRA
ncbi:MAG: DNA cytosine methyltransferase [Acidobacteria bacterium]|nr:DNA cytosine methyltransferase [Acidobacteriota bacterium]